MTGSDLEYVRVLGQLSQGSLRKNDIQMLCRIEKFVQDTACLLKIVFFAQEYSVWPTLKPIYESCLKDETIIAQLVHVPF